VWIRLVLECLGVCKVDGSMSVGLMVLGSGVWIWFPVLSLCLAEGSCFVYFNVLGDRSIARFGLVGWELRGFVTFCRRTVLSFVGGFCVVRWLGGLSVV